MKKMSNLKVLKNRIGSVTLTGKITNAMRMIAVSNLKKTHGLLSDAYPYLDEITRMLRRLVRSVSASEQPLPPFIQGKQSKRKYMIICVTSDQGLCGHFTQNIVHKTQQMIDFLSQDNTYSIQLICFGSRGAELLKKTNPNLTIHMIQKYDKGQNSLFTDAQSLAHGLIHAFDMDEFDICSVVYSKFESAAVQRIQIDQVIPLQIFQHENKWQFLMQEGKTDSTKAYSKKQLKNVNSIFSAIGAKQLTAPWGQVDKNALEQEATRLADSYDYFPSDRKLLDFLLVPFIETHVYQILLNSIASENAARMIAMESASKSSIEMIQALQKQLHRKRQEQVTNDLAEVTAGTNM